MSEDNDMFYYRFRLDDGGRLKDVMWVDARSRAAYEYFGDVVCFDSTYITNDYELPFANFVGVNHHGQTILLGCALLSREDCETFVWLFRNWKECMGKAPVGILTDQDAAMKKALMLVMPETRHRWCLWHILQKFYQRLGAYEHYETISDKLQNAIYDSLTPEEFNESWDAVIKAYNLEGNDWLQGLYENSEMRIPAYMKHLFWAGMKTTQRSESINSFFDKYVTKKTRLYQFVQQYVNAMEVRLNDERAADADSARHIPNTYSNFPLEKTFRKFYTNGKFAEVQLECVKTMYVRPVKIEQVSDDVMDITLTDRHYILNKKTRKEYATDKRRHYKVLFNKTTKEANCVCKLFECHGILCRHIIAVYDSQDVSEIPEKYILDRWRKDLKRKHTKIKVAYYDPSKTEDVKRMDRLNVAFDTLSLDACTTEEDVALVLDMIEKTKALIAQRRANLGKSSGEGENILGTPSSVGNMKGKGTDGVSPGAVELDGTVGGDAVTDRITHNCLSESGLSGSHNEEGAPQLPLSIKDPPTKKKPAHRTRERRYLSCVEKNASGGRKRTRPIVQGTAVPFSQEVRVPPVRPFYRPPVPYQAPSQTPFEPPPPLAVGHYPFVEYVPQHLQQRMYSSVQPNYPPSLFPQYGAVPPTNPKFHCGYVTDYIPPYDNELSNYHSRSPSGATSSENGFGFEQPQPFGFASGTAGQPSRGVGPTVQYSHIPDWYIRDCDLLNLPDPSEQQSTGDTPSTPCGSTT